MFDLAKFDTRAGAEEGAILHLRDLAGELLYDDENKPVTIRMAGADSRRHERARRLIQDRRMRSAQRGSRTVSSEELDEDALTLLAACAIEWSGFVLDGQPIECDEKTARQVFERFPDIRDQADRFIADRANFMKASQPT